MGVTLQNCFADLDDPANPGSVTGFVLVRIMGQTDAASARDTTTGRSYALGSAIARADIDPVTGCWTVELPSNSDISPPGTYYEVFEHLNGQGCAQVGEFVQFDTTATTYPTPTSLHDVSITHPDPGPTNLLQSMVLDILTAEIGTVLGLEAKDSDAITLDLTGLGTATTSWCLTPGLVLDPALGNRAVVGAGGLIVDTGHLQADDTSTVDLTLTGTGTIIDPHALVADVRMSGDAGNCIEVRAGGLWAPCYELDVVGTGGLTLSVAPNGDGQTLTGSVDISANPDNILELDLDGLHVPATVLITDDGAGINLGQLGTGSAIDPWVLTPTLVVDPASTGQITVSGTGLRVDETPLVVTTNGTVAGVVQTGIQNHIVDIRLLSGDAGNTLAVGADGGLYYAPTLTGDIFLSSSVFDDATNLLTLGLTDGTNVTVNLADLVETYALDVTDSTTVDLTRTGTGSTANPWIVTASVIVDPLAGLAAGPNGLSLVVDPASTGAITVGPNGLRVDHTASSVTGPIAGVWTHVDGGGASVPIASTSADAGNMLTVGANGGSHLAPFAITNLTDVDTATAAPALGQVLIWDGTNWTPQTISVTDTDTTYTVTDTTTVDLTINAANVISGVVIVDPATGNLLTATADGLLVAPSGINTLTDVDTSTAAPTAGDLLSWDGANWVPSTQTVTHERRDSIHDEHPYDASAAVVSPAVSPLSIAAGEINAVWISADGTNLTGDTTVDITVDGAVVGSIVVPAGALLPPTLVPAAAGVAVAANSFAGLELQGDGVGFISNIVATIDWSE